MSYRIIGAATLYGLAILIYSQTFAFSWDSAYHLLAAQLIAGGRKPYIDFCFPQTPLNAYWNALWMRLLGETWRTAQAMAALFTTGSILLPALWVSRRFPASEWRLAAGLATVVLAGVNGTVFIWGAVAQPYGLCMLAIAAAFLMTIRAVDRRSPWWAAAAGLFAGAGAASSLLTVAAAPVLAGWMLFHDRPGSRWKKFAAFAAGAALPCAPIAWLFTLGPRQTWFNVVQYHAHFRSAYWPETTQHDLEVLTSWVHSAPATITGGLAIYGLWHIARIGERRSEFYLCAWLAAAFGIVAAAAHPTFPRYFVLAMPFLAILASAGLYALRPAGSGMGRVAVLTVILLAGLARSLYDRRDVDPWSVYERLACKVDQVTPAGAPLLADEPIYFLTRRTPPPGLELYYTHKIDLPPSERHWLHILTEAEVREMAQSGFFATVYTCESDDYGIRNLYRETTEMDGCTIYFAPRRN